MLIIKHRINSIKDLKDTPNNFGVEFDLHSYKNKLVVHHDPFIDAINFDDWLTHYNHSYMFINIKEEGIENRVIDSINKTGNDRFLLFDLSFPSIINLSKIGFTKIAMRMSKYESINTVFNLKGKIDWIWLDMFDDEMPISTDNFKKLQSFGMKICIVSPELQGRDQSSLLKVKSSLELLNIKPDAVCTKYDNLWIH